MNSEFKEINETYQMLRAIVDKNLKPLISGEELKDIERAEKEIQESLKRRLEKDHSLK